MLDHLRQVIGWRGYGQRDPLNEYKTEALELFSALLIRLRGEVTRKLMHIRVENTEAQKAEASAMEMAKLEESALPEMSAHHIDPLTGRDDAAEASQALESGRTDSKERNTQEANAQSPVQRKKVGRNVPCPCGSGKKYKHCCGAIR